MNDLVEKAQLYATQIHARINHQRKYSNKPYDVHLKQVAELVAEVSDDPEMLAAAWLHDAVEDTPATLFDIEREFGPAVAQLVSELTDISRPGDGNRAYRKRLDLEHLAGASNRAKTVKLADLIDNCRDICKYDKRFARVYLAEMDDLLGVLDTGDQVLLRRAQKARDKCLASLGGEPEPSFPIETTGIRDEQNFEKSRILKLFTEFFSARDIAEPLASFDSHCVADQAAAVMDRKGWFVAGLREEGEVVAYFMREDLKGGFCGDYRREFIRTQKLPGGAPLSDVIYILTRHSSCFIEQLGGVSGIIVREHIDKPVVRMWLFGIITIIESRLVRRITTLYPDDSWIGNLSKNRSEKAREMQSERIRRGQHCTLVDCLQFSDKAQVLLKDDSQLEWMGFRSRSVAKKVIKDLESLRNNLAHSQSIVVHDWPQIARMTQRIHFLMGEE
ncbi:MAG: HD domain-containing protein [Chromatiales bacterium]|jgi:hypothetical protein